MGVLGGVEEKQVRSAVVMMLRELTSLERSASSLEHTQKCYQRYLEPQTLRRGATYEKFASDLIASSKEQIGQQRLGCGVHSLLSVSFFPLFCTTMRCFGVAFA